MFIKPLFQKSTRDAYIYISNCSVQTNLSPNKTYITGIMDYLCLHNVLDVQMFDLCVSSVGLRLRHVDHISLDQATSHWSFLHPAMRHIKSGEKLMK